jgi:hypothetical protein
MPRKRSHASYRKAALKGWRTRKTRVRAEISASKKTISRGQPVTITWKTAYADAEEITIGTVSVSRAGHVILYPGRTTRYTITAKGKWENRKRRVTRRSVTVEVKKPNLEYIIFLEYKKKGQRGHANFGALLIGPDELSDQEAIELLIELAEEKGDDAWIAQVPWEKVRVARGNMTDKPVWYKKRR